MRYEVISTIPRYKVIAKSDALKLCKAIIEEEETQDLIDGVQNKYIVYDVRKDEFVQCR